LTLTCEKAVQVCKQQDPSRWDCNSKCN
jgi:hypothetical protein